MRTLSSLSVLWIIALPSTATAQNITVQQPVFSVTSVSTTVSVPDRGGILLGGISRAGDSRSSFGPIRNRSGIGTFRENSSMSAHVYIHDFAAMDEYLLNQGRSKLNGSGDLGDSRQPALDAYDELMARQRFGRSRSTISRPKSTSSYSRIPRSHSRERRHVAGSNSTERAEKYYQLGLKAEARGSLSVAKMHFRLAKKHGSREAVEKLSQLEATTEIAGRSKNDN